MPITSQVWSALKAIKKSMKLLISLREPNVGERHEISRESFLLRRTFTFCTYFDPIRKFINEALAVTFEFLAWRHPYRSAPWFIRIRGQVVAENSGKSIFGFLPAKVFVAVMPLHKPPLRDKSSQLATCQLSTPQKAQQHATDMKIDNEIFLRTRFSRRTPSHNWRFN